MIARHAVCQKTGATTWARKVRDDWKVSCLNHKSVVTVDTRAEAWHEGAHPEEFCNGCADIIKGKAEKISRGRLRLPGRRSKQATAAA